MNNVDEHAKNKSNMLIIITINNEDYRIIGVFDGKVKVIKTASIGGIAWNTEDNKYTEPD